MQWQSARAVARRVYMQPLMNRFSKRVLKGAMRVAHDKRNPIRGNLFASAIRELIGYNLDAMAPDKQVCSCKWYCQAEKVSGPTRRQKFMYVCHKGLSPDYLRNELFIDADELHKPLKKAFDRLHKATHVRPGTILQYDNDVIILINECLLALASLFEAAEKCQAEVCEALTNHLYNAILDKLMDEVYGCLDELSTHTRVDGHYIDDVNISFLDHETVVYEVGGSVEVDFQYGSDADVRNDSGATMSDSYPYVATLTANCMTPDCFIDDETEMSIDTSSFYE